MRKKEERYLDKLTQTEYNIIALLSIGATTPEISILLYLSKTSIERSLSNIYIVLGTSNRPHAVAEAFRQGYLE